jgi:fluoride ion exporter CrcB/FEX
MNLATLGWSGLISCAGACGALARYLIGRLIATRINTTFPWATLLINVSGAFLIGLISGLVTRHLVQCPGKAFNWPEVAIVVRLFSTSGATLCRVS